MKKIFILCFICNINLYMSNNENNVIKPVITVLGMGLIGAGLLGAGMGQKLDNINKYIKIENEHRIDMHAEIAAVPQTLFGNYCQKLIQKDKTISNIITGTGILLLGSSVLLACNLRK